MDELIKMVSQKTGISEDQARTAVNTVVGYIKGMLPTPIAGQIDGLLGGSGSGAPQSMPQGMPNMGEIGDMAKGIGGMFGKKEE